MNPRAIAAWSAATLGCVLLTNNPILRALLLLAAINFLVAVRPRGIGVAGAGLAAAVALAVLLNSFLAHAGTHAYLTLPAWLPLIGGRLTAESAVYGLDIGAGLAGAVLAVLPLSLAADPLELVDALPAGLERTGAALAASLSFIPGVSRTLVAVTEAQRMRGWRPRGPRSWAEVAVPVMLTAIEDSLQLAEAMAARAYGAGPRTHYPSARWTWRDGAVAIAAIAALGGLAAARLAGLADDWYPYPSLAAPHIHPLVVLVPLVLAVPALLWRSPP